MQSLEGLTIDNRYHLGRKLDEGGFGAVYEAEHRIYDHLLRKVAVKILKTQMEEAETGKLFADALLMAGLADQCPDPSIKQQYVTIYDAARCSTEGPLKNRPFIVMELVDGGNLAGRLRPGPFPLTRTVKYMRQILAGMSFMHQGITGADGKRRPIVHRDLKPPNILVKAYKEAGQTVEVVKITDFGLAFEFSEETEIEGMGGQFGYMAPEYLAGAPATPACDVYALGIIFYEMLTGTNPFASVGAHLSAGTESGWRETVALHLAARGIEQFKALDEHEELTDKRILASVIRKSLSETDRYEDARLFEKAFLAALEEIDPAKAGPRQLASRKTPIEEVKHLVVLARQYISLGQAGQARDCAEKAMNINRDSTKVSNGQLIGEAYELMIKLDLEVDEADKAQVAKAALELAQEGYNRRPCRGTCLAMARCYQALSSPVANQFFKEANRYRAEV